MKSDHGRREIRWVSRSRSQMARRKVEGNDYKGEVGSSPQDRSGEQAEAEGMEGGQSGMNYIVRAWKAKDGKSQNDFWEFETEEEANDFADWKANQLRKYGYEFDVRVYQQIG